MKATIVRSVSRKFSTNFSKHKHGENKYNIFCLLSK